MLSTARQERKLKQTYAKLEQTYAHGLSFDLSKHAQVRRVLDQIRGRSYEEALMILEYTPYRSCELIIKTLVSVRHVAF